MAARNEEAARYREAAQLTLDQLDWCIEYFRTIRKPRLSYVLARNRSAIARALDEGGEVNPHRISGAEPPPVT